MGIERRKRRQDGTFGELENVFSGKTNNEKIKESQEQISILAEDNADLMLQLAMKDIEIDILAKDNSEIILDIAEIQVKLMEG